MIKLTRLAATIAVLLSAPAIALALPADRPVSFMTVTPVRADRDLTSADLETWLDGYMPSALTRGGIPGAEVVVVKGGQVVLEKGYGVADVRAGTPVDPRRSLFRVGSVSKLFTWTAVMQLVEAKKIDLDADVNTYLDFRIPPQGGRPITMRDLMTHTAGFEESFRGIATLDPRHIPSLASAVKRATPKRIYEPGATPAYSNYGAALAGYIVERVSGERFEDYIAHHIFEPLKMSHSTFVQPLPTAMRRDMSNGYFDSDSAPQLFEQVVWSPAGGLTTDADDMSRFLIAHLQNGQYDTARILQPQTAQKMHTEALTLLPPLDRMELGFYEDNINGHRAIGHDGDTLLFHSLVRLFPDDNIGLFLALNGNGNDDAASAVRQGFYEGFAGRYLPGRVIKGGVSIATATADAKLFHGVYGSSRSSRSGLLAALSIFQPVRALQNSDGTLSFSVFQGVDGALIHYREVAPMLWRDVNGRDRLAAVVKEGRVVRFSDDQFAPVTVWLATPLWRSGALLKPLLILSLAVIALTALAWPFTALLREIYGTHSSLEGAQAHAQRLMRIFTWVILAAVAGWVWFYSVLGRPFGGIEIEDYQPQVHAVQLLGIIALLGGLTTSLFYLGVCFRLRVGWAAKTWSIVSVLAISGLLYTAWICNFLTLNLRF